VVILALRDLRVRYKQAAFGVAWAVLQPLIGTAILVVLFHRLAHLSTAGIPYIPFTLVGFAGWTYFSSTVTDMTASFVLDHALVTKIYYPRFATPLATILTGAIGLGIGLVVGEVGALSAGISPPLPMLLLPLWLVALGLVSLGFGLPLATLNIKYRDVAQLVGFAVQLMLYLTPVAYASSVVPSEWQLVYHLNPMVAVLDGMRWSMLGAPAPGLSALVSAGSALVLLIGGLRYFTRTERRFADVI
jgi:ABC-type polysaccharide/polyol phosphate export permease